MDRLKTIDNRLDKISRRISFAAINPVNIEEEKHKFFSRRGYNPQFEYGRHRSNLKALKHSLTRIRPDRSVVGRILSEIRDRYKDDISLVEHRGTSGFTDVSLKIHGLPKQDLVRHAKKLVFLKIRPEPIKYTTKQIIGKLRMAFVKYGFPWEVQQKEMIAMAAVKTGARKLLIKKKSRFSRDFLKRIIVHEIGTHIMRSENGAQQPYRFFSRGLPGYLMTEEGLAVFNEEQHDCLNNYVLKVYAGRVLAINSALRKPFCDTYRLLRKYFTKNIAWRLTLRAKRGLGDTSEPGAFTKDFCYLQGYLELKRFSATGGKMNKLYYGKIGLQHIETLEKIPNLVHPSFLPMFRYYKYFSGHFSSILKKLVLLDSIQRINLYHLKLDKPS